MLSYTVKRRLPVNLKSEDLNLFSHELQKSFEVQTELKYKWVVFDSWLNILFSKSYLKLDELKWVRGYLNKVQFVKLILLFRFRFFFSPVLIITDSWSFGYFHWMMDCLPKCIELKKTYKNIQIRLPAELKKYPFVADSLKLLNFSFSFCSPGQVCLHKKIITILTLAPTGNYKESSIAELRKLLLSSVTFTTAPAGLRIFISRRNVSKRKIENENEILHVLKGYGFSILYCENMQLEEQIKSISEAEILVSNHGAGLTNILFMKEGASVLELRAEGDAQNNCYFSLASALKMKYHYQLCPTTGPENAFHHSNLIVNTSLLKQNIEQILKNKC